MRKAIARGPGRRDPQQAVAHIGIDEKAYQQGHTYATLLTDLDAGRVIDLVESRRCQTTKPRPNVSQWLDIWARLALLA